MKTAALDSPIGDKRYCIVVSSYSDAKGVWSTFTGFADSMGEVHAYCRGYADALPGEDDLHHIWEFDREVQTLLYKGVDLRRDRWVPLPRVQWEKNLVFCDAKTGHLFVFGEDGHLDLVLTTEQMRNTLMENYAELEKDISGKTVFGTMPSAAAAWLCAALPSSETVSAEDLKAYPTFLQEQERLWQAVGLAFMERPSACRILQESRIREFILQRPEMAGQALLAGVLPEADLLAAASLSADMSAKVLQKRPDIKDRRLVLAAAGIGAELER